MSWCFVFYKQYSCQSRLDFPSPQLVPMVVDDGGLPFETPELVGLSFLAERERYFEVAGEDELAWLKFEKERTIYSRHEDSYKWAHALAKKYVEGMWDAYLESL